MGSISVPTAMLIAAGTTAAGTAVSMYAAHEQGVATANQAKAKARVESERAAQEQITMRQNLLKALASQNAGSLGAVGTGGASSFGANARRQISQAQNDLLVSKSNASAQISLLDAQAANAKSSANLEMFGDLVKGAGATVDTGAFTKPPGG